MRISDWSSDVCSSDLLHIAGVGRRAVEHLARKADAAHFLGAQRIFQVGEAGAFELDRLVDMMMRRRLGRHEQVPDAGFLRSEEHTSELQSLMRSSNAASCLKQTSQCLRTEQA